MTKDVLVRVKGTQFMDDENDVIEMITAGTFNEKNGKKYLIYDETIVEGGDQTHNIVKIWPDKVEVTKRGLVDTHMTFECGKKHMCNYMTPVGLIILGITTSALEVEEDETSMGIGHFLCPGNERQNTFPAAALKFTPGIRGNGPWSLD